MDDISSQIKAASQPAADIPPDQIAQTIAQWTGQAPAVPPQATMPEAPVQPQPELPQPQQGLDLNALANVNGPAQPPLAPVTADYGTKPANLVTAPPPAEKPAIQPPILSPELLEAAAQPTAVDIAMAHDAAAAPLRAERAQALALDKIDAMQRDAAQRQAEREADVKRQFAELDGQARSKSLEQLLSNGSFGTQLGTVLALSLGAVGQGLQGAKSNPVIDFFDKIAERQANKDKLTLDQKAMLQRQLYEHGQQEIQKLEQATNSAYRKDMLRLQYAELQGKKDEATQRLMLALSKQTADASKWNGRALTPEQEATLTLQERRNVVPLPDGRKVLAQSYEDASKFKSQAAEINNALGSIRELQKLGRTGSKLSPTNHAQAKSMITKIVGALRLPYTGPGVLTDSERQMLIETLGSPLGWLSLRSVELAKLKQVEHDLMANLQSTARTYGIQESVVPVKFYNVNGRAVPEDRLIKMYKQQLPTVSEDKIRMAIQKQVPEL